MGLDTVELLIAVEEAFDISIKDEEAKKITTVGEFYSCILSKLGDANSNTCLSNGVFYRTRRSLMNLFGVSRSDISLRKKLEEFIPSQNRKAHWQRFSESLDLVLPKLGRPTWMDSSIIFIFLFLLLLGLALLGYITPQLTTPFAMLGG